MYTPFNLAQSHCLLPSPWGGEFRTGDKRKQRPGDHPRKNVTIQWRINEAFDFQMTEYELRKQFLEVSILREDGEQVGNIRINLFLIATGPFRQDFALCFPSQRTGRLSFDIKLSQIIDLKIESL